MLFFTTVYQKVFKAVKWYFTPAPNLWDSLHKAAQEFKQDLEWQDREMVYSKSVSLPSPEELRDFVLAHGSGYYNCNCQEEVDALTEAHIKFAKKLLDTYGCSNSVEFKLIHQDLVSIANRVANLTDS
jgi:hypothetical protein